jgi:dipeptidyl aminopeptidase/acylaminoacyl peptidase
VAGGEQISIFQPQFSPDGEWLAYVSDDTGWWQIYLYNLVSGEQRQITHTPAEHGLPAWVQGMRTYAFTLDSQVIYFLRNQLGRTSLWKVDLINGDEQQLPVPAIYTHLEQLCVTSLGIAMLASSPAVGPQVILLPDNDSGVKEQVRILRRSRSEELPAENFSIPQDVNWSGMDGEMVYGLFYPPVSDRYEGVGKPPLIVMVHGGPTGQSHCSFDLQVQFFTSRGYAVLDVNYRGSSGYGRAYREKLRGMWGVYDVQDTVSGARFVTDQGWADSSRMVIMGGSAGGLSVLKILEEYPGVFKAGICLYAVSDLFSLAADTHKFEAHYLDSLIGPLPEAAELYRERSPIFHVERIQDPLAVFQGQDDRVVPAAQSEALAASLRRRGVPHVYHVYTGEGHGFRKIETIEHFYSAVEKFLLQYVIFA